MMPNLLPVLFAGALAAGTSPRPIIAVFDIETQGVEIEAKTKEALTEYLTARLAESQFKCIPRADIRERLLDEKAASYRDCIDERCQIELGRELAAEKTVVTKIMRIGEACQVSSVLFDLETAASETAATRAAECDEDALHAAVKGIADQLTGVVPPPTKASHETPNPSAPLTTTTSPDLEKPFATCRLEDGGPGFLGWCHEGTFLGVLHLGLLVYAGTAEDFGGVGQTAIVNRTAGTFYGGVQGGLINMIGQNFYGVAQASAVNVVGGDFTGIVQSGGFSRVGGTLTGIQAGGINIAKRVRGVQVGVLNVAEHLTGVQLGLLNFAGNGLASVLPIVNFGF